MKNVVGLTSNTYADKLAELQLDLLYQRCLSLDLVEYFNIIKGFSRVNRQIWFTLVSDSEQRVTRTTYCPLNIVKPRTRLDVRNNFFSIRVMDPGNYLPVEIENASNPAMFKYRLNQFFKSTHSDDRPRSLRDLTF